jgi:Zn-dependent protease
MADYIIFIPILFFSITFHEVAHGFVADKLGDPTAKLAGRLTLNPIVHIDPFGTIILPAMMLIIGSRFGVPIVFGYAKPVPINPYHFKNPRRDTMLVSLAGPLSNFALAALFAIILKITPHSFITGGLAAAVIINVILGIFNILPIPPLDGSKVLASFLPHRTAYSYLQMERYGFFIIIILIMTGFFRWFVFPLAYLILKALGVAL